MAIKYRIVKRKNNLSDNQDEQYIMQAVHTGIITQEQMAYEVSNQCTVHQADVIAVLTVVGQQMHFHLGEGKIVELGQIGRFKIGFQGKAQPTPELLNKRDIKKFHINYQPVTKIKNWLKKGLTVSKEPK